MNQREFASWFDYHAARFPNWGTWLAKMATSDKQLHEEVTKAFYETLADRTLADCKEASKRLAVGDEPEIDQFDQHARAVRAVAKKLAGGRIKTQEQNLALKTKERTFRCKRCWDASPALVTVFHNHTVEEARDVQLAQEIVAQQRQVYLTAVACDCDRGTEHARVAKVKQFNDRMLLVEDKLHWHERLQELVEWANREDAHAWNPGD